MKSVLAMIEQVFEGDNFGKGTCRIRFCWNLTELFMYIFPNVISTDVNRVFVVPLFVDSSPKDPKKLNVVLFPCADRLFFFLLKFVFERQGDLLKNFVTHIARWRMARQSIVSPHWKTTSHFFMMPIKFT